MTPNLTAVLAILAVAALTVLIGTYGVRMARTTSDFLVASRAVRPGWNAAAISGEYLSAASFLGIAGLVLSDGADALWYPVGFAGGFLALLLFVAAPLRRSGAYTLPDFAEARLESVRIRRIATAFVVLIGWLYLIPQLQGAGLTVSTVTGYPSWVGAAVVAVIVTLSVVTGGMRSITFVQAFQYWLKLTVLAVPVFVLLIYQFGERAELRESLAAPHPPYFTTDTVIDVETSVELRVDAPTWLSVQGVVDGSPTEGPVYWGPSHEATVAEGSRLHFAAGAPVPVVTGSPVANSSWLAPLSAGPGGLFGVYSLLVALFLGTMGLPHVLARYYTNPDGHAARRTTVMVFGLLGLFYVFPVVSGVLARLYVPQLLVTGKTDAAVLLLPSEALLGWPSLLMGALVAAGAFAAFLSTASGLVVSMAGVVSTDVFTGRVRDFRAAAVVAGMVPLAFALASSGLDLAQAVALGFAVAASSFCPLLILGIWWRGLTDTGAAWGMVLGGGLAAAAVVPVALGVIPEPAAAILATPAAVTVPLAFVTMIVVSRATRRRVPEGVSRIMLRMHAPDRLGLGEDRGTERMPAAALARARNGRHRAD